MSARAEAFIKQCVEDNIQPEAFVDDDGDDPRPASYARACQADAEAEGISLGEMEEVGSPLESQMIDGINAAAQAEVRRLAEKNG